jgi:hypothetical protein
MSPSMQDVREISRDCQTPDLALNFAGTRQLTHGGNGELPRVELLGQPVDLSPGRAEDDGLGDGDGLVEVTQGVQLPVLLLDGNVELPDTFQGQLFLLDQDPDGVPHELLGDLEHVVGHGGREEDDLGLGGEELEDVVHVLGETLGEHLVGLVEGKDLDVVGLQESSVDHCRRQSNAISIRILLPI